MQKYYGIMPNACSSCVNYVLWFIHLEGGHNMYVVEFKLNCWTNIINLPQELPTGHQFYYT